MPNQSHSGIYGIPWHRCDRCGCEFRITELTPQRGLLLCRLNGCYDNPETWNRDVLIQGVLTNNIEQELEFPDLLGVPDDTTDYGV